MGVPLKMLAEIEQIRTRGFPDLLTKVAGGGRYSALRLRDCVLRDLRDLFNARLDGERLEDFPQVVRSVLRYGVRDPGSAAGAQADYAAHLAWAIRTFEPRLEPSSVSVLPITSKHISAHRWVFRIDGMLQTQGSGYGFRCFVSFDLMESRAIVVR